MKLIPKQFLKGSFYSATAAVAVGICNYIVRRVMANHLAVNDYAFYFSTFSLISFLLILTQFGLSDVVLFELPGHFSAGRDTHAKGVYDFVKRSQTLLSAIFFLLLCASIPLLKKYYYDFPVSAGNLLIFFTLLWGFTLENTTLYALNSVKRFGTVSLLRTLKAVILCVAVYLCVQLNSLRSIIVLCVLATTGCTLAGDRLFCRRLPQSLSLSALQRKKVLQDGGFFIFLATGYAVMQDIGTITVAFFSSASEVVLFNIALPIAMIVNSFNVVLQVFMPMIADSFNRNEKRRLQHLFTLMFLLSAGCMLIALPILYFGGEFIIRVLFSERFTSARISTLLLVEAAILALPVRAFLNFFNTVGQQKISVMTLIPAVAAALILFPLLSWRYGASGAAGATFLSTLIWLAGYLRCFYRFMREWRV